MKRKLVVIAGPTASGKSDEALKLALRYPFEIVNYDSMQVYRYMDIGTAKPSKSAREHAPHHLYDIRNPDEDFNAADFVIEADTIIDKICSKGKIPLFTGGTGFYMKSLLLGLDPIPSDNRVRDELLARESREGLETLYGELKVLDPLSASMISPNDRQRVIRALEATIAGGKPYSGQRKKWVEGDLRYDPLMIILHHSRESLNKRIDTRVEMMLEGGFIDEVANLVEMGYGNEHRPMRSIGYRHVLKYLSGEGSLGDAEREMKHDTRRYAKRQQTWFRKEAGVQVEPPFGEKISKLLDIFLV